MAAILEPRPITTRSARLLVVLVGAAVSVLAAATAYWLGVPFAAAILIGGAVAGPLAAVRRARRLVGPGWLPAAIASGIEAPLLAAGAILVVAVAVPFSEGDTRDGLAGAAFATLFVVAYAAIFGLPFSVPVAVVAGYLVRRAARLGPERGRRHIAGLVVIAMSAGVISLAAATGALAGPALHLRPIDWAEQSAAVRLELTIENWTADEPDIEVGWHEDGGSSGWFTSTPPCTRSTDLFLLDGTDWFVARASDNEVDSDAGIPIVTAADWPGRDVAVTVIIERGTTRVEAGVRRVDGTPEAIAGRPGPT